MLTVALLEKSTLQYINRSSSGPFSALRIVLKAILVLKHFTSHLCDLNCFAEAKQTNDVPGVLTGLVLYDGVIFQVTEQTMEGCRVIALGDSVKVKQSYGMEILYLKYRSLQQNETYEVLVACSISSSRREDR